MTALADRYDDDHAARLELRALEKMLAALCADVDRLRGAAQARGTLGSRESDLQSQAFAERRRQAADLLETARPEPREMRITRLEKMVDALTRSREYFSAV